MCTELLQHLLCTFYEFVFKEKVLQDYIIFGINTQSTATKTNDKNLWTQKISSVCSMYVLCIVLPVLNAFKYKKGSV